MAWAKVATVGELPVDSVIEVEHEGSLYAICNAGGELRALSGVCPHQGGPLGQGTVIQGLLVCPWHMWEFDSTSGACLVDDRMGVPVYCVKVEADNVLVDLPEDHA
jgi:nitrite reductase (NADH) small subunit